MRLIDADNITEVAEHAYGEWVKAMAAAEGREIKLCYKRQELCKAVKGVADDCPTIDPETLRPTAEWGDDKNSPFYVCSACRSPSFTRSKFCKECGAKMVNPKSYEKVTQQRLVNGDE